MSGELREALDEVARRARGVRLWAALAACWLAWALLGVVLAAAASLGGLTPGGWRVALPFVGLAAATGLLVAAVVFRSSRDRRRVALRIERRFPELATGLLVAVEDDPAASAGRSVFLQQAVLRSVLDHRREHDWDEAVPPWTVWASELAHAATLAGLLVVTLVLALGGNPGGPGAAAAADLGQIASGLVVEPGDTEIERGSSLLVVARFNDAVPGEVDLAVEAVEGAGAGSSESRRPMARSLEDPTFAARVDRVDADLTYRVAFAGRSSETYRVRVFDYPAVLRIDADLDYPDYTGLAPKTVEDIRHVTAVEGTALSLRLRLNKEVASARLVDGEDVIPLSPSGDGSLAYGADLTLTDPRRYRVELVDADGRANKDEAGLAINVTRNRPPEIRVARPARDVRVSPIEELPLAAEAEDDFGIARLGVTLMVAGSEPTEVVLGPSEAGAKKAEAGHLVAFESLGVEPDQLASYYFWAEDVGPDGNPRRSRGDMFFAEIRPFEEIFREGQSPAGGQQANQGQQQGGAGQQAMELAELQKQIINATWSLIRRDWAAGDARADAFAADATVVLDSQRSALEQAEGLGGELSDPGSIAALEQATGSMTEAADRLAEAVDAGEVGPLDAAIAAEQAAYQALLKLRDREFQVVQGNPGQPGGGGAGGPSQRQLQQLELTNDENRYEQQRAAQQQAGAEQSQADRELRQVLNRLRELARRQEDLNDRVQELQSALEAAQTEEEREEIERQLKRLREQQEQLLRDADELRERMEVEENRDRMAEAREQVEQSREHLRRASEALQEGRLSQAITEGTRAGQQLDELGEQLRQQTSDRFAEDLERMRDQARQLAEDQRQLTEQLQGDDQDAPRSLRGDAAGNQLQRDLAGQREQLGQLLDQMRQTVQDAEQTEPLLAEELFEAVRRADDRAIGEALEAAEQLTGLGVSGEAARASRTAAEGLDQLREGVERAADRVLGGDTAALRLAQDELDDLAEQVGREIDRNTGRDQAEPGADGQPGAPSPSDQPSEGREQDQQGAEGDAQGESQRPGSDQAAEGQGGRPGEGQAGEPPGRQDPSESEQPGEGEGQLGGQRPGEGQQGGQGQQDGQQGGEGRQGQGGRQADGRQGGLRGTPTDDQTESPQGGGGGRGGLDQLLDGFTAGGGRSVPGNPITGDGFREWSDRMRDVEELLEDPELSAEAARIRDRVRGAREEFRRHATEPDWEKLQTLVAEPIRELRDRVAEELRRREAPDELVPIDRDPVPPRFAEGVRRYFERLGSGE